MKDVTALRRLALLRGAVLLIIIMAGLGMNLVSPAIPAKAQGEDLTSYPAQGPNNGTNPLNYHGDPVITNPQAYLIFEDDSSHSYWGQSYNGGSQTNMQRVEQYFNNVSGSNFEGILTQYYDTDSSGTKHYISNTISVAGIALDTKFSYSNECTSTKLLYDPGSGTSPNDMTDEITKEINTFHWTNTASSIFFVFTPTDYALTEGTCLSGGLPGLGGGLVCAYHETVGGYNYAAMNYEGSNPPAGCDTGDGNPTDTMINEASHEQFEAITNPKEYFYNPGSGWNNSDCNSVLGVNACEMGDKCEASSQSGVDVHPGLYLNGNTYPGVQGEFSNATGACEYTIAPPYPVVDVSGGGAFRTVWLSTGDVTGPLGDPIDSWYSIPGGQKQDFVGGSIYWSSATGTDEVQGAIYTEYTSGFGGPNGGLGFPTSDEVGIAGGRVSYFYGNLCGARGPDTSGAAIYWTSTTGAHQVGGCIYNHYWSVLGGPAGDGYHNLGFPTSNVLDLSGGYVSYFYGVRCGGVAHGPDNSGSALYYSSGTGAREVQGCTYAAYQRLGGPAGSAGLGFPVSDENRLTNSSGSVVGWVSYFQGHPCNSGSHPYGSGSAIYVPESNATASGGFEVRGCIYDTYLAYGGPTGKLGFPVTDEYTNSAGEPESNFQGGYIIWTASGASVTFYPCGAAALCPTP